MKKREDKNFFGGNVQLHALVTSLDHIYKDVDAVGLNEESSMNLQEDIDLVAGHFGITPKQAVLLGHIVEHNTMNGSDTDSLAEYMGCSNIEFIGFHEDLKDLEKKGVILRGGMRGRKVVYVLSNEAAKSVETGEEFKPRPWTGLSADEIFTRFRMFFSDYGRDVIDGERLLENIFFVIESNPQVGFCSQVMDANLEQELPPFEQKFFFYLCHRFVSFGDSTQPLERLFRLTSFMDDDQRIKRMISNEQLYLQKMGLVTFGGTDSFKDVESLGLSDEARKKFLDGVTLFNSNEAEHPDVKKADSIAPKELFYNEREAEQLQRLENLLDDTNFKDVQKRLTEMKMRKGFAVLFSGGAGCGKTAGVYELARKTGRDVFSVDMSKLKSKWVGDSEKIVKSVFNFYAELCRRREKAPILLFNEADAIFSKRIEDPSSSVDQMMNAIQNICLDAMENLEGIMVATTNLAGNFCDEAFARRFIFKVDFTMPEPDVRARIWRSMIPSLSEEEAATLGAKYSFSGGNIENIARKAAVGYVLSGEKATMEEIDKYCGEETLRSSRTANKIGF